MDVVPTSRLYSWILWEQIPLPARNTQTYWNNGVMFDSQILKTVYSVTKACGSVLAKGSEDRRRKHKQTDKREGWWRN